MGDSGLYFVSETIYFDAAHRILGQHGKSRTLHGHRYKLELTVSCSKLNAIGIGVDFDVLKNTVGKWIEENWDHNALLHQDDPLVDSLRNLAENEDCGFPFLFEKNPTVETMVDFIFENRDLIFKGVLGIIGSMRLKLCETPTSSVERYYDI